MLFLAQLCKFATQCYNFDWQFHLETCKFNSSWQDQLEFWQVPSAKDTSLKNCCQVDQRIASRLTKKYANQTPKYFSYRVWTLRQNGLHEFALCSKFNDGVSICGGGENCNSFNSWTNTNGARNLGNNRTTQETTWIGCLYAVRSYYCILSFRILRK